jgi:hypothetical protein
VREDVCPFCHADVAAVATTDLPRVARIALVTLGAAAVATGCASTVTYYGAPPIDSGVDAADAGQDAIATFYGGPPLDSGGAGDSGTDSGSD